MNHLCVDSEALPNGVDVETLQSLALFAGVDAETLVPHLPACAEFWLEEGDVLIHPSRPNQHLYVIVSGSFGVYLEAIGDRPTALLERGTCVGELSILDTRKPSATVIAAEGSHVIAVPKETVWELIDASHGMARNLLHILARRTRQGNETLVESHRHAVTDPLTGLPNRRGLEESFGLQFNRAFQGAEPLCVVMIDIDHFKDFNDTYGHPAGDLALKAVARALRGSTRPTDLLARYGGEEFSLMLPKTDMTLGTTIAERVRMAIANQEVRLPHQPSQPVHVTASLGVAVLDGHDTMSEILNDADQALYAAKEGGRNRVSAWARVSPAK